MKMLVFFLGVLFLDSCAISASDKTEIKNHPPANSFHNKDETLKRTDDLAEATIPERKNENIFSKTVQFENFAYEKFSKTVELFEIPSAVLSYLADLALRIPARDDADKMVRKCGRVYTLDAFINISSNSLSLPFSTMSSVIRKAKMKIGVPYEDSYFSSLNGTSIFFTCPSVIKVLKNKELVMVSKWFTYRNNINELFAFSFGSKNYITAEMFETWKNVSKEISSLAGRPIKSIEPIRGKTSEKQKVQIVLNQWEYIIPATAKKSVVEFGIYNHTSSMFFFRHYLQDSELVKAEH